MIERFSFFTYTIIFRGGQAKKEREKKKRNPAKQIFNLQRRHVIGIWGLISK